MSSLAWVVLFLYHSLFEKTANTSSIHVGVFEDFGSLIPLFSMFAQILFTVSVTPKRFISHCISNAAFFHSSRSFVSAYATVKIDWSKQWKYL